MAPHTSAVPAVLVALCACGLSAPYEVRAEAAPGPVLIDPGHGGSNTGTRATGLPLTEKELTLTLGRRLAAELQRHRVPALLTHHSDVYVTVRERVRLAALHRPQLLISLHANAAPDRATLPRRGVEVHVLDPAVEALDRARRDGHEHDRGPTRTAAARRTPASAPLPGFAAVDLRTLGPELAHSPTGRSLRWAVAIRQAVERTRGDRPGPACQAHWGRLNVLRGVEVPAVVAELGYLSDPDDSRLLADPAVQARIAVSLAELLAVFDPDAPGDPTCAAR